MRKTLLVAAAAIPLAVFAQNGTGSRQGGGPAPGAGPGPGARGPGPGAGPAGRGDPERMEKRLRLARTLGLAEALDLEPAQALKLGETLAQFDQRRVAAHTQIRDSRQVLRRAAMGEQVSAQEVDQAIQKSLDARAQLGVIDREIVGTLTKDLNPQQKARAVLFLGKFHRRFGGMGNGMMGGGMMNGRGMGMGMGNGRGMGMGPGMGMGMGSGGMGQGIAPGGPSPSFDDEDED